MDVTEAIRTRLEVREFTDEPVADETRRAILDAGRLAPSGKNFQHWAFVLVDADDDLRELADLSTSGGWISDADFAVMILTDPQYYYHEIDAARAVTYMQFAAWDRGVGSCIYTGFDEEGTRDFLDAPDDMAVTLVGGFGTPTFDVDNVRGHNNRKPLDEVAHRDRYGQASEASAR
jgi:nitroreductase